MKKGQTKRQVKMTESTDEDRTESKTQARTTVTTWKPPHVETQSVLQLHLEDDHRRRCEQCILLEFSGSMNRPRQHQQMRDVMVNVSRHALRPFGVLTYLGRNDWNNWNDVTVHTKRVHRNLGTTISTTNGETLSRSENERRTD